MYHENKGKRQKKRPHKFPRAKWQHFVVGMRCTCVYTTTVLSCVSHWHKNVLSFNFVQDSYLLVVNIFIFFLYIYIQILVVTNSSDRKNHNNSKVYQNIIIIYYYKRKLIHFIKNVYKFIFHVLSHHIVLIFYSSHFIFKVSSIMPYTA